MTDDLSQGQASPGDVKPKRAYRSRGRMSEAEKLMRDLEANYKQSRKKILESLEKCSIGTNSYLQHVKALDDQFLKFAEFRRDIGILPKNVGSQTATEYKFRAVMGKGGSVQTVPVQTKQQALDLDRAEQKEIRKGVHDSAEDEAIRAELEAEFGDGAAKTDEK